MRKRAFTLIEVIVTIAAVAIVLPTIFSIFYVILQQQSKISKLAEVKRQGDYAMSAMENIIRDNAVKILDDSAIPEQVVCDSPNSSDNGDGTLSFADKYGNKFGFYGSPTMIDPHTEPLAGFPTPPFSLDILTTDSVVFSSPLTMSCTKEDVYTAPIVKIAFTIDYNTSSARPEDQVSLPYETSVALRNFGTP